MQLACSVLLLLHFVICHSKKCHRPRTSSCHTNSKVEHNTGSVLSVDDAAFADAARAYLLTAAATSFCCANNACRCMEGSSETGLVTGEVGGHNKQTNKLKILRCGCTKAARSKRPNTPGSNPISPTGGYCPGCKQVCCCSEACQRECWNEHKVVYCRPREMEEQ